MNLKAITSDEFIDFVANGSASAIGIHLHALKVFKLQYTTERKRALLAYRDDELMGNDGLEAKARLAFLLGGENDVIFVVFQAFDKIERETLRYTELHRFTEVVVIGANERRQIIARNGVQRTHSQFARELTRVLMHNGDALIELAQRIVNIGRELFAIARKLHIAPLALKQRNAELLFEGTNGVRQRGLRDIKLLGGLGIVLQFGKLAEIIQLRKVHRYPFPPKRTSPLRIAHLVHYMKETGISRV